MLKKRKYRHEDLAAAPAKKQNQTQFQMIKFCIQDKEKAYEQTGAFKLFSRKEINTPPLQSQGNL